MTDDKVAIAAEQPAHFPACMVMVNHHPSWTSGCFYPTHSTATTLVGKHQIVFFDRYPIGLSQMITSAARLQLFGM